jgi:hypothetical protein
MRQSPEGVLSVLINDSASEGAAIPLRWAAAALAAVALCFLAPFMPRAYLEGPALLLGLSGVIAFAVMLLTKGSYRSLHGLLPIAPYCVMAMYALRLAWRSRRPALLRLAVVTLVYLVLGAVALFISFVDEWGHMVTGLEWGQRYLLPLYPLFAVLALIAAADYWRSQRPRLLRVVTLSLVAVTMGLGVYFQVRGLEMLRSNLQAFSNWESALRKGGPVFTDVWWLPAALADLFVSHEVFYARKREEIEEWVELAKPHKVRRFQFVGRDGINYDRFGYVARYRLGRPRAFPPLYFAAFEIPGRGPRRFVRPKPAWRSLPPDAGP